MDNENKNTREHTSNVSCSSVYWSTFDEATPSIQIISALISSMQVQLTHGKIYEMRSLYNLMFGNQSACWKLVYMREIIRAYI